MKLEKEFYTTEEIAQILGVHYQSVRNYMKRGQLQFVRVGRNIRISKDALKAFIAGGKGKWTQK